MKTATNILQTTIKRAVRASKADGRIRLIFGVAQGFAISTRKPPQNCYVTDGARVWFEDLRAAVSEATAETTA